MVILYYVTPYQKEMVDSSYELNFIYLTLLLCYYCHIKIAYIGNIMPVSKVASIFSLRSFHPFLLL